MRIVFAREVHADLEEIVDDIGKDNPARAVTYAEELRDACLGLLDFPNRFPVVARLGDDYRRRVHRSHSIFYLVYDDHVRIVRIVHNARLSNLDRFL